MYGARARPEITVAGGSPGSAKAARGRRVWFMTWDGLKLIPSLLRDPAEESHLLQNAFDQPTRSARSPWTALAGSRECVVPSHTGPPSGIQRFSRHVEPLDGALGERTARSSEATNPMTKSPRRKPSKQDILAEVLGRISPAGVEPSAAGIELVETGPAKRLVDALGVPFLSSAEYQQIPPAARRVASEVASISASVAEEIRSEVLATAMPLQFGDLEVLQHIGEAGPQADEIVGIVPRAWVLDFVTIDMGFVERQEIQLRPTVLVATPSSIHWTVPAGDSERWRSLPIDGVEGESVPEWSELFGRGPFASFSHEDLGLAAEEGDAALFDIFRLEDQVLASTAYAIEGIAPDQISIGTTREMSEAYGEAEVMAAADLVNSRIEASLTGLRENAKVSSAFVDDLFALAPGLLPFLLSGGFNAFLPLGLDPQGRGGFRHSNVVIHAAGLQKQSPDFQPRVDPAGEPMRSLCGRRGATLPLFVEPTGSGAGSHMA